jgi:hypothetical protein
MGGQKTAFWERIILKIINFRGPDVFILTVAQKKEDEP